jgi:hypothetical protein
MLYLELSRIFSGYFKPLLDPGGGFTSDAKCPGSGTEIIPFKESHTR